MTDASELRALRARAYGPDADIATDAAAAARLADLENRERQTDAEERSPQVVAPPRRRIALLWCVSVVVAGVVSATATWFVATRVGDTVAGGASEVVATLEPDPTLPFPSQISTSAAVIADGVRFDDYLDIAVVSTPTGRDDGSRCLYVLPEITQSALVGGCSAGPFPARAVFVVTSDMPAALLDRHDVGTALQFELRGDAVVVEVGERFGAGSPPPLVW